MAAFGLLGPVLVTLLAIAVAKGLHLIRMKRIMKLRAGELLPWGSLGAILGVSAIGALPVLAVRAAVAGPPVVVLLAEIAVYGLTYFGLVFAAGLINPDERAAIGRWLRLTNSRPLAPSGTT
jgi:hypothetical protein